MNEIEIRAKTGRSFLFIDKKHIEQLVGRVVEYKILYDKLKSLGYVVNDSKVIRIYWLEKYMDEK